MCREVDADLGQTLDLYPQMIDCCSYMFIESHCRSSGHDPGSVPYFWGDRSWNNFYGHSPPSADARRVVVSYKRKYVHKVLVKRLVTLAQEKSVVRSTDHLNMTIAVDWDVKPQTKQTKTCL